MMGVGRAFRGLLAAVWLCLLPVVGTAQDLGVTISPVVTLDFDRLFQDTTIGQSMATRLEQDIQSLAAENKRIAEELRAEELDLTEKRPTMEATEFRNLADAFDKKVQKIRTEQDAKQQELQRLRDLERQSFIDAIGPILSAVAQEHGALVVLERRSVFLSADGIDITDEAIRRIDEALANGDLTQGVVTPPQDPAAQGGK